MPAYAFVDNQCRIVGPGGSANLANGAAPDKEGITFEPVDPRNTMNVGADGRGVHNLHASRAAKVTVRLLKTSPQNSVLQQMLDTQSLSAAFWGQNIISFANGVTGDKITCNQVAFNKETPLTYAVESGHNEWSFDVIKMSVILGKSSNIASVAGAVVSV